MKVYMVALEEFNSYLELKIFSSEELAIKYCEWRVKQTESLLNFQWKNIREMIVSYGEPGFRGWGGTYKLIISEQEIVFSEEQFLE